MADFTVTSPVVSPTTGAFVSEVPVASLEGPPPAAAPAAPAAAAPAVGAPAAVAAPAAAPTAPAAPAAPAVPAAPVAAATVPAATGAIDIAGITTQISGAVSALYSTLGLGTPPAIGPQAGTLGAPAGQTLLADNDGALAAQGVPVGGGGHTCGGGGAGAPVAAMPTMMPASAALAAPTTLMDADPMAALADPSALGLGGADALGGLSELVSGGGEQSPLGDVTESEKDALIKALMSKADGSSSSDSAEESEGGGDSEKSSKSAGKSSDSGLGDIFGQLTGMLGPMMKMAVPLIGQLAGSMGPLLSGAMGGGESSSGSSGDSSGVKMVDNDSDAPEVESVQEAETDAPAETPPPPADAGGGEGGGEGEG